MFIIIIIIIIIIILIITIIINIIHIYIYTLLEAGKKTNGLWRGVERAHRLFCYFLAHWGPGPWAHGPPKRGPQGPGPHSSELDGDRRCPPCGT